MSENTLERTDQQESSFQRRRKQRKNRRIFWIVFVILVAIAAGGFSYYQYIYLPSQVTVESTDAQMQTATIRQGNLVLYASGAGELKPASDVVLTFPVNAEILSVEVAVGDVVEAGQVLMTLDTTDLVTAYQKAQRNFNELVSPASIAKAKQTVASYEVEVQDSESTLKYLISPEVYYWEGKIADAQAALAEAKNNNNQTAVADAERLLANAKAGLKQANYNYQYSYLAANFTYQECSGNGPSRSCTDYVSAPTEASIQDARYTVDLNKALQQEAQDYLTLITTGTVPVGATGSQITNYFNLQEALQTAQENLASAELVAPISGVVTALSGEVGDLSNASTSVTITDVSSLHVQVYLDSSDWDKMAIGYDAEVVFDSLPDKTFNGKVVQVDPFLTSSMGASLVGGLVQLDPDSQPILAKMPLGSSAAVDVIGGRAEGAILVPVEALKEVSDGQYSVFVMVDGEPKLRLVQIGIKDIYYAEVISGLEVGDVVTTGIVETQ
jgi:HlyD family secretion protein